MDKLGFRHFLLRPAFLGATLAMSVGACSSSNDDSKNEGDNPPIDAAAQQLVDALCGTARTCCDRAGVSTPELAQCPVVAERQVNDLLALGRDNVETREPEFSQCLAAIKQLAESCAWDGESTPSACESAFVGTLTEGEACVEAHECGDGLACAVVTPPGANIDVDPLPPGTCERLVRGQPNEYCAWTVEGRLRALTIYIDEGVRPQDLSYCHVDDGLVCFEGQCAPTPLEGESCYGPSGCAAGLYCETAVLPYVCLPVKGHGDSCDEDEQCGKNKTSVGAALTCDDISSMCAMPSPTTSDDLCEVKLHL